ncbi:unnamed protein product [Rhodiola kirilowii]
MSCLFRASSAIFLRTTQSLSKTTLHNCCSFSPWKQTFINAGVRTTNDLEYVWGFRIRSYSSRRKKTGSAKMGSNALMEAEKDEFFVVRKGDLIGVFNNLNDCQAQVGSTICDPPVSVFKGHSMRKDTAEYLASRGLKGAAFTIRAADLKDDLFGTLFPCPVEISVGGDSSSTLLPPKRPLEDVGTRSADALTSNSTLERKKIDQKIALSGYKSCKLEFDGGSKGNPGQAGAAAILRADDGSVICSLREGLGTATSNVAEYRALILGLKHALRKGYTHIRVQGDSNLVCMQAQGLWNPRAENMVVLCNEAKKLISEFTEFNIKHVLRGSNADADAQANLACKLKDGEVEESLGI